MTAEFRVTVVFADDDAWGCWDVSVFQRFVNPEATLTGWRLVKSDRFYLPDGPYKPYKAFQEAVRVLVR